MPLYPTLLYKPSNTFPSNVDKSSSIFTMWHCMSLYYQLHQDLQFPQNPVFYILHMPRKIVNSFSGYGSFLNGTGDLMLRFAKHFHHSQVCLILHNAFSLIESKLSSVLISSSPGKPNQSLNCLL